MPSKFLLFCLVNVWTSLAVSATSLPSNFTSTECVAPSGFDNCFATAQTKADSCIIAGGGDDGITVACTCVMWLEEINCAASNCWNEVYSCQYQALIINYMRFCPAGDGNFPYFPAPDNAPGGCSCNIGEVYLNVSNSFTEAVTMCKNPSSIDEGTACYCCMEASALTSIYGLCPNTDPGLIGLSTVENDLAVFDEPFDHCGPYLSQYDCVKDIGFSPIGTATFINPTAMPANGTETLYTTGGPITTPLSGSVITWSYASSQYTASAAANEQTGSNSKTTGGVSGGSSASSTATAKTGGAPLQSVSDILNVYVAVLFGIGTVVL